MTKLKWAIAPSFLIFFRVSGGVSLWFFAALAFAQTGSVALESAQQSYRYLNSTLNNFQGTGRLVSNPGIDGADLEAFIEILQSAYDQFSAGFNRNSAMCQFYLDPENGRMTLEEKAEIAFSFLAVEEERIKRYIEQDKQFKRQLANEFGSIVLDNIERLKKTSTSNQQLPTSINGEAAVIAFIDSACV